MIASLSFFFLIMHETMKGLLRTKHQQYYRDLIG